MATTKWTCIAFIVLLSLGAISAQKVKTHKRDEGMIRQDSIVWNQQGKHPDCEQGDGNCGRKFGEYPTPRVPGGYPTYPGTGFVIPGGYPIPGFAGSYPGALYCTPYLSGFYCTPVSCPNCRAVRLYFDIHDHHPSTEGIDGRKQISTNHEEHDGHKQGINHEKQDGHKPGTNHEKQDGHKQGINHEKQDGHNEISINHEKQDVHKESIIKP